VTACTMNTIAPISTETIEGTLTADVLNAKGSIMKGSIVAGTTTTGANTADGIATVGSKKI